jgi:hypothetical protein
MATQYTAGLTTGQVLTAATMNQIGAVSEPWTPVINQGNTPLLFVSAGEYQRIQKTVFAWFNITVGAAGTAGQSLAINNLPVTARYGTRVVGGAFIYDSSTLISYNANCYLPTTTGVWFLGDWATNGVWGTSPNLAINANDIIRGFVIYEAA